MNPEDRARQDIDRQLGQCGWVVQDKGQMNISAALGVAVREFPMLTGEVDYLLYISGKAIGVLEAKPKGHPLECCGGPGSSRGRSTGAGADCGRGCMEKKRSRPSYRLGR